MKGFSSCSLRKQQLEEEESGIFHFFFSSFFRESTRTRDVVFVGRRDIV